MPRFLSQNFTDAEGHIWVLDKQTGKIFPTKPENIAGKNYLYSIGGRQNRDNALEEDFGRLEGRVAPFIAAIIANRKFPETGEDKGILLCFLCHLVHCAPNMATMANNEELVLKALEADYIKTMKQRPIKDFIDKKNIAKAMLETDNLIYAESFGDIVWLLASYIKKFQCFL
ncbi:DUF4238 domain-containing protein [Candidatus Tokpelaia sp.]|uniref:DUF4238 domain-containing protein n=1 Tax=Candidatus Tokpelaia sp. TaxID=2233777 RepID=UPI0021109326|nr:DUF4238 domain-containing protein [Candidatus Tokpelaia sp.]